MPDASILPFPATRRLDTALRRLQSAQVAQVQALASFRESLERLRAQTSELERSTRAWQCEIDRSGAAATRACEAASQLEATAERMAPSIA
ncbi:hypothetical protein LPC08_10605 [Roseomonas sp. OT10]|uniref:hypothetical protein n=1 Tax=Roseomonas cutis TaxID=2897332 RepID=UPI001E3EDF86|nr:hypothetical protein [Roseomonas sp. OT10]UFN51019.1 hypothetical protein LPC08_10605 [Roseomonas sp. OT10]